MRLINNQKGGLQSRVAYNFYLFSLSYTKMALSLFFATLFSTKLSFQILFSSASRANPPQESLRWTEGSCSGEASLPGLQ